MHLKFHVNLLLAIERRVDEVHFAALENEMAFPYAVFDHARNVARVLGEVEAHPDVALGAEMVDLVGFDVVDQVRQLFGIRKIAIMKKEANIRQVGILIEVVDSASIQAA